ncbi:SusC/RagA family TonB-linked outer membrane protein [Flavitalea flava]
MRKSLSLMTLLLSLAMFLNAQTKEITGKITDSTGNPISGASIKIKGVKGGTSASTDGSFRIGAPQNGTLIISAIGFEPQEVKVANSNNVSIQLRTGASRLMNEVVVTSLGIKREKRSLTYSTQEIKGDALVAARQDNIVNGLAGKVSGVQVTNSTGMPGSSARIVIRGATSLTGENQPLFVVDGVPIDNSEAGAIDALNQGPDNVSLNQGSTSNRGIDIDPNIIETVNILKGAAATALYGAAAARGAIIITTKNPGRSSKPSINVSSSYSMSNPILYPIQNKYGQGFNGDFYDGDVDKISGSWGPLMDTLKVNGAPAKKYNPQKDFFRTGHTTDNNISVSGANDKSKYLLSYSYLKNDGITPKTNFTRHSFFGKYSSQLSSKVVANFQLNYISSINNRMQEGNGLTNPLWTIFSAPISWNPHPDTYPDGSQRVYRFSRNSPYFILDNTAFVSTVNRFLPTASLVYTPLSWMSITERLGADIYTDESNYHESDKIVSGFFNNSGGATNRVQSYRQFNNDLIVEMHKDLGNDLFGNIILGSNIQTQSSRVYTQTGVGLSVADFYNISSMVVQNSTDILTRKRKVGFYAQANLEWKRMLNLSLTGRYDGSSVLATNKNFYPYGSAALGFIFTELMKDNTSPLSFGKVRVSYSSVGNDDLAPYSLATPYIQATGSANNILYPFNGQNGFLIANVLGNAALKNESLNEFETGLELKFFHNRLSFEGSYFDRRTKNLLTPVPIGPSSGYYKYELNAGSMQDKGVELLVSGTVLKTRDITWDVSANFTKIKNTVLSLAPGVNSIQFGGFGGGGGTYAFAGKPYGALYGSKYQRNAKGELEVDDTGSPLKGDNDVIGNSTPDFTAGLSNTFSYKNFSLNFVFDWRQGGDIYNLDNHYNWFYGTPKATEDRRPRLVKGVYAGTDVVNTTMISAQDYFRNVSDIDEAVIEKGTYVKLRSVGLSYSINPSVIKRTPFKSITINLTGNNLWIYKPSFTGSDPEANLQGNGNGQGIVNYITPTSRTYILGMRLAF